MSRWIRLLALALVAGAVACSDQPPAGESATGPTPTEPGASTDAAGPSLNTRADPDHARLQQLAKRVALSLKDPALRAELRDELNRSPYVEHKLQFQRLIHGKGAIRSAIARASHQKESELSAEADGAMPLELYFPVPAHRTAWDGGTDILVATEVADHETPVAFDVNGKRHLLDPDQPPATPVLALVPQETDFDAPPGPSFMQCQDCGGEPGGGGTGGSTGGISTSSGSQTALYLTHAQFVGDFEGWLKGSPEFEIHIMGPASGTDTTTLVSYQCIGEHAPPGYQWDMNSTTWSGTAKLFTFAQMDAFAQAHPGQAYLIYALEDDDTACGIKTDENRLADVLSALSRAYQDWKAAKDQKVLTSGGGQRVLKAAKSGGSFLSALYSWLKSNDDVIGFAISDAVTGRSHPGTNWTVIGKNMAENGWLNLEMR